MLFGTVAQPSRRSRWPASTSSPSAISSASTSTPTWWSLGVSTPAGARRRSAAMSLAWCRAVLAAGARHVVVSLWPVDDQAGCLVMTRLYERLVAGDGRRRRPSPPQRRAFAGSIPLAGPLPTRPSGPKPAPILAPAALRSPATCPAAPALVPTRRRRRGPRSSTSGSDAGDGAGSGPTPAVPTMASCSARSSTTPTTSSGRASARSSSGRPCRTSTSGKRAGLVDRALFAKAGASGFLGMDVPEELRRRRRPRLPLQRRHRRGDPARRRQRRRSRAHIAQRHLHAVLPAPRRTTSRRARWLPGHRSGRADHRGRHDRAGHRVRPGVDDDDARSATATTTSSTDRRRSSPTASTPIS